jgi:hypothetical protein
MAEFGWHPGTPDTDHSYVGQGVLNASRFQLTEDATVTKFWIRMQGTFGNYKFGIYTDAGGGTYPGTLVCSTDQLTIAAAEWSSIVPTHGTYTLTAGYYWIAVLGLASSQGETYQSAYNSGYKLYHNASDFDSTWVTTSDSNWPVNTDVYVEYTPAQTSSSITPTVGSASLAGVAPRMDFGITPRTMVRIS